MDALKIDNFRKVHGGLGFPEYLSLDAAAAKKFQSLIAQRVGLENCSDSLSLVRRIDSLGALCVGAEVGEGFSLRKTLSHAGVKSSEDVYVNWYRYDAIDKISLDDLDKYFHDVWYPGADDIDIFDDSLAWILSISHGGKIKALKM